MPSLLFAAVMAFFTPADIRPEAVVAALDTKARDRRGRAIVARGDTAHGGADRWAATDTVTATLTDTWASTGFRMAMPLTEDTVALSAVWDVRGPGLDSRYTVETGSQAGAVLALDGPDAWRSGPDASPDAFTRVFTATMAFLPTLPFRAADAEVLRYVDTVERDGRTWDRVLMTWGDPDQPNPDLDQYLLYYAQDDGRLHAVECTVRDFGPAFTGYVAYEGWIAAGGIQLPRAYRMGLGALGGIEVHRVALHGVVTTGGIRIAGR